MEWIKYSLVYTADSIRTFDSKSNRTADSIRDSIRTQKNDSQVPSVVVVWLQIACISPTSFNSAETMNTLRYATRAKRMKTKPVVIMVSPLVSCFIGYYWGDAIRYKYYCGSDNNDHFYTTVAADWLNVNALDQRNGRRYVAHSAWPSIRE